MIDPINMLQVANVLLGKTHKWLLQIHNPSHELYWCSSDPSVHLQCGTQKELDWMLHNGITSTKDGFRWAISAITEPALSEADAHKALDLMFLLKVGPVSKALTPKSVLECLINYVERAARMLDLHATFRGFPDVQPRLPEWLPMPEPVMVATHGQLLADDEVAYNPKVETGTDRDKHYWYCRALYELLPYVHYQRITEDALGIVHYVLSSPEGLAGANAVWDLELGAFNEYAPEHISDKQLLYRVLSADNNEYVDTMIETTPKPVRQSLSDAGHKLITICNYARRQPLVPVDISNETRHQLIQDHLTDALAPITKFVFEGLS